VGKFIIEKVFFLCFFVFLFVFFLCFFSLFFVFVPVFVRRSHLISPCLVVCLDSGGDRQR